MASERNAEQHDIDVIVQEMHDSGVDWRKVQRLIDLCRAAVAELLTLRSQIATLKGDADRYRWLRSHSWHEPYHIFFGPGCNQLEPHHLDQAIDNEMKYPIIEGEKT